MRVNKSQSRARCSVENLTPCPKSCMMGAWREDVRGGPCGKCGFQVWVVCVIVCVLGGQLEHVMYR